MSRQRTFNISSGKDATGKWLKPTAYCSHCGNDGMVQLDERVDHAPCPMCVQGGIVEERLMGAPGLFWSQQALSTLTWERGCSVRHVRRCRFQDEGREWSCGKPADGAYCEFHRLESNRVTVKSQREWVGELKQLGKGLRVVGGKTA